MFLSYCFEKSLQNVKTFGLFFQFIVLFVAKVLTGQMKEVNDVREYEEDQLKERTDTNDQMSSEG